MFRRNFNKFLKNPPVEPELYPYLYSINFKKLSEAKEKINIEPIQCSQCGAILTNLKDIKDDPNIGIYYECIYCGTINMVSKEGLPDSLENDLDFIIEDIKPKKLKDEKITGTGAIESDLYISVIDISGSMRGAKIEAVKSSLIQTLNDFKINAPLTKYILIAFESIVYYYLRSDEKPIHFKGNTLFSLESMKFELKKQVNKNDFLGSLGEFADGWIAVVKNLRDKNMTALGPALYLAITSFEIFGFSAGRITLLTDGLANQGVGNLSGTNIGADRLYEDLADICNINNLIVDIVGVSAPGDNNEMGLQTLGKITDSTGGMLYMISSEEMEVIFSELRKINYIGKDVMIKIITPKNLSIKNITGAFSSKAVNGSEVKLGVVTDNRELFVEFDGNKIKDAKMDKIPIQLQVAYKDLEGRKRIRVISDQVKITEDERDFKSNYDQKLNAMMNIQKSGAEYYKGDINGSKKRLNSLKQNIAKELGVLNKENIAFKKKSFSEGINFLDDELDEMAQESKQMQKAPVKSFMAVAGQARLRSSQEDILKRLAKKKKQK